MSNGAAWTAEMKDTLLRHYSAGLTELEIAERMGCDVCRIKNALFRARSGRWGEEYRELFCRCREKALDADITEANERGISYGQLQAERMREQTRIRPEDPQPETAAETAEEAVTADEEDMPFREDGKIDMIEAIDALTACAKLFGMNGLVEVRGSCPHERAGVIFTANGHAYTLTIALNEEV